MGCQRGSFFRTLYGRMQSNVFKTATLISPTLNTKMRYRAVFKRRLNLKDPQTFNEKLLWLKLYRYRRDPLVIQCSDKYLVRDYITQCGYADTLNELIGAWDNAADIPWDELPDRFALKWNFGAGMNIICKDKSAWNRDDVVRQMNIWKRNKCWLGHSEMHYKYIPKKIICETYLEFDGEESVPDYKVYCFHGEPQAIFVMRGRGGETMRTEFFDTEWNRLENSKKFAQTDTVTEKPACLARLLDISRDLAKPFPFVRCDFYVIGERIYFGELTFTPAGGMYTSQTTIDGKGMEEYLHLDI